MEALSILKKFRSDRDRTPIDPEELSRFYRLLAEYRTLSVMSDNQNAARLAATIAGKRPASVSRDDVDSLEAALLRLQPAINLSRQAWQLRKRYREIVGPQQYQEYLSSKPFDSDSPDEVKLRADLESLLSEIHKLQIIIPRRESQRNNLTKWLGISACLIIIAAAFICYLLLKCPNFRHPIVAGALVGMTGAVGGIVSAQRRLQLIPGETSSYTQLKYGWFSIAIIAPLSGLIFAMLLSLMFLSGLLEGALFPKFLPMQPDSNTGEDLLMQVRHIHPQSVADICKLFVWSFIAGFAERFVPDVLDRLMARAESVDKAKALSLATTLSSATPQPDAREEKPGVQYTPTSIAELMTEHEVNTRSKGDDFAPGNGYEITGSFLGEDRNPDAGRRAFLSRWHKYLETVGSSPPDLDSFNKECLISEQTTKHWVLIQDSMLARLTAETTKDSQISLRMVLAGATDGDLVFLVNEFSAL